METAIIREKLHEYINLGDEKFLEVMLAKAQDYFEGNDVDYEFTAEDIKELDELREKRLRGESETFTWEEAKKIITGKA